MQFSNVSYLKGIMEQRCPKIAFFQKYVRKHFGASIVSFIRLNVSMTSIFSKSGLTKSGVISAKKYALVRFWFSWRS